MRNAKKKPASGATTSSKSSTSRSTPTSPMNVGLLEQLVKLMSANDLNTVEIRDGNQRVVLKRGAVAPTYAYAPAAPAPAAAPVAASAGTGAAGAPATAAVASDDANLVAIKSPMVGTFYTAATPEAKPFVSVGTRVDEDTDVCIIEAMKVFNNIKAETRGTITKVLVTNGQTVEFGQTLYLVKP